jgi:hypothetical protein
MGSIWIARSMGRPLASYRCSSSPSYRHGLEHAAVPLPTATIASSHTNSATEQARVGHDAGLVLSDQQPWCGAEHARRRHRVTRASAPDARRYYERAVDESAGAMPALEDGSGAAPAGGAAQ